MDLQEYIGGDKKLHWYKFRTLFVGLKEDNVMTKIMKYRSADTSKMDGEEKKYYERMKKLYKLPCKEEEREADRKNKIYEQLRRTGSIKNV